MTKILGDLPDDILEGLKDSGLAEDAILALGKVVSKGIDPELLKIVLRMTIYLMLPMVKKDFCWTWLRLLRPKETIYY